MMILIYILTPRGEQDNLEVEESRNIPVQPTGGVAPVGCSILIIVIIPTSKISSPNNNICDKKVRNIAHYCRGIQNKPS